MNNLDQTTEKLHFTTTGVSCSGCANSVTTILKRLPGVLHVEVDVAKKTAEVEVNKGAVRLEDMLTALKPAGYGLVPVQ